MGQNSAYNFGMGNISEIVQRVCIIMPALLMALVFHEYAHAWVARKWGDGTAQWSGRLTLNPMAHIDPMGTIVFPLISIIFNAGFFFGWAKPVPIDPRQFRDFRKGLFWVACAGPISNILFGFVTAFVFVAFLKFVPSTFALYEALQNMLYYLIGVNFVLAFFNLIPIPPLDGSNIVLSMLSYNNARRFEELQQYSIWILLALLWTGALQILSVPVMLFSKLSIGIAAAVLGLQGL